MFLRKSWELFVSYFWKKIEEFRVQLGFEGTPWIPSILFLRKVSFCLVEKFEGISATPSVLFLEENERISRFSAGYLCENISRTFCVLFLKTMEKILKDVLLLKKIERISGTQRFMAFWTKIHLSVGTKIRTDKIENETGKWQNE